MVEEWHHLGIHKYLFNNPCVRKSQMRSDGIVIGADIFSNERAISDKDVEKFAKYMRIDTPNIFVNEEAARERGFDWPIVPGPIPLIFITQLIDKWVPNSKLKSIDYIFRRVIPHNKTLRFSGVVTDIGSEDDTLIVELEFKVESLDGEIHIGGGCIIWLPLEQ
jgi:hypothetical protein